MNIRLSMPIFISLSPLDFEEKIVKNGNCFFSPISRDGSTGWGGHPHPTLWENDVSNDVCF